MATSTVTGILASTRRLEKYDGRFRASVSDLEEMREAFIEGRMFSSMQHDPLQAFDAVPSGAWVEEMPDGEHCLKVSYDVDESVHEQFEQVLAAAGAPGALSYARTIKFGQLQRRGPATVLLAGEASNFSQADIESAAEGLEFDDSVTLAELVEFAAADHCRIVIIVVEHHSVLKDMGLAAFGALLYPALQKLWRAGKQVRIQLQARRDDGTQTEAIIVTDDLEQVDSALRDANSLDVAWRQGGNVRLVYNQELKSWETPA